MFLVHQTEGFQISREIEGPTHQTEGYQTTHQTALVTCWTRTEEPDLYGSPGQLTSSPGLENDTKLTNQTFSPITDLLIQHSVDQFNFLIPHQTNQPDLFTPHTAA